MFRVANWLLLAGLLFVGIACEADPNSFETEGHYPADSLYARMGEQLGRVPTAKDIEARKGSMPSKSLYWHTFGSLNNALKEAGFDVPVGEERLERAIDQGSALALRVGRLPKFADWAQARRADDAMLTEWQVYRMFDARRGAWSTFQFLIRKRLEDTGVSVSPEGRIG